MLCKEVCRSLEEGPHVTMITPIVTDGAQARLRGAQVVSMTKPTKKDIDNME